MDVLADAEDILNELGVHFEASASEATAAAMLAASINYPMRGAVTWKSTVGTNVASDALANLASAGVKGGALIILGEDYGEGASIMQERTHAFAMKSQMWLLDPRPHLPDIVRAVEQGFELSEASNTPVMLMLRIRACHVYGRFTAQGQPQAGVLGGRCAGAAAARLRPHHSAAVDVCAGEGEDRAALAGRAALHRRARPERIHRRASVPTSASSLQGGLYNNTLRALELLGCADAFGTSRVPLYVLNVTYPLVADEWVRFCSGKRAVLVVEEGQPEFIEQAASQILRQRMCRRGCSARDLLPMDGEYTVDVLRKGLGEFLASWAPAAHTAAAPAAREVPLLPAAQARGAGAAAAVGAVHRLPGATVLLGDEVVAEGDRAAAHQRRHRLPLFRDAAAVQHGQQHHGLRSRGRCRLCLWHRRRPACRVA